MEKGEIIQTNKQQFAPIVSAILPQFELLYINPLPRNDTIWQQKILVNNSSDDGLLPDDTKPLPDPMLTRYHWHPSQCSFRDNV